MQHNNKRIYSQNFLTNSKAIQKLITCADIQLHDTIVEIGSGKGAITNELLKKAQKVIAVEVDKKLASYLEYKFSGKPNISIYAEDIRTFSLPHMPYKVVSNIPFSITADIIYKILYYSYPPTDAYLIVQEEAAKKFAGTPHETQFSILAKPWFHFTIIHSFSRYDFSPVPRVSCVLLHIHKRQNPELPIEERPVYGAFVIDIFHARKKYMKTSMKKYFSYAQYKKIAKQLGISSQATPTQLSFQQWIAIYKAMKA